MLLICLVSYVIGVVLVYVIAAMLAAEEDSFSLTGLEAIVDLVVVSMFWPITLLVCLCIYSKSTLIAAHVLLEKNMPVSLRLVCHSINMWINNKLN